MNNLPPGVSVSDLPGNRPIDELWDRYFAAVDTDERRHGLRDRLMEFFDWRGLGPSMYDHISVASAINRFVGALSSDAVVALDRGLAGGAPTFDEWLAAQEAEEEDRRYDERRDREQE